MDYTKITLGALLTCQNETIKRNAMSILKELQKKGYAVVDDHEEYHRHVQNFGEQHPAFHTKEHKQWLKGKQ